MPEQVRDILSLQTPETALRGAQRVTKWPTPVAFVRETACEAGGRISPYPVFHVRLRRKKHKTRGKHVS
jgi:hypothetical protein